MTITTPLEAGCFYHIYNRGNNSERIFKEPADYMHFLKLMQKHISPCADIYCYCLLNNHFHFLVKVHQESFNLLGKLKNLNKIFLIFLTHTPNHLIKNINERVNCSRVVSKRKIIEDEFYFTEVLFYIHANPQNHKIIKDFRGYKYSSYQNLLSCTAPNAIREEIFEWFGGEKLFEKYHAEKQKALAELAIFDN